MFMYCWKHYSKQLCIVILHSTYLQPVATYWFKNVGFFLKYVNTETNPITQYGSPVQ